MIKLHRINALIVRHLYLYQRSVPRLMDIFFWPTIEILLWGFLSLYLEQLNLSNVNIISVLLGAVVFWSILQQSQGSVSTTFLEDIWEKNLLNIFVTPISVLEFILATVGLVIARVVMGTFVISVLAFVLYKFNILVFGFSSILLLMNLIVFGWTLGFFLNAIILRFGTSAQVLAFGFIFLVQPFSAVFYPVSALPVSIQFISYIFPSTYVFEGMRSILSTGALEWSMVWYAGGLNILYLSIVLFMFYKVFAWVKIKGLLLKLD